VRAQLTLGQFLFDLVPKADIAGGMLMFDEYEDVVIASFMDNEPAPALFVGAVLPVAAGITAEQDMAISSTSSAFSFGRCASDFFIPRHYTQNRQPPNSLFHPFMLKHYHDKSGPNFCSYVTDYLGDAGSL
jgi:hypothetical protein